MKVFSEKKHLQTEVKRLKSEGKHLGLVPTMGALHQGHLSLVEYALVDNNVVVVSVFVNPTQFDNPDDLKTYPRTLDADVDLLKTVSENIWVYAPNAEDIYEGEAVSEPFDFDGLEHEMEGAFRDGHFNGVGTIVKKLLEAVKPNNAYFGEKDFQQLQIIKKLVEKHQLPVNIVGCPILREADGLAMSSRNTRLTEAHRNEAPFIYNTLKTAKAQFGTKNAEDIMQWVENEFKNNKLLKLEYFIIADEATLKTVKQQEPDKKYRGFIAVYAGNVRLIDNMAMN